MREPRYWFPLRFIARWLVTALIGRRRDAGDDGIRLLRGRDPAPRVEGGEHVPPDGPVVLVMNHYERHHMGVWWPALLASSAARHRRFELPSVRWLITDRFYRFRAGFVPIPGFAVRWFMRLVARTYHLTLVPREPEAAWGRAVSLRYARRLLDDGAAIGVTPEGAEGPGPALVSPVPNSGTSLAWLSRGGVPLVPVAVFEDDDGVLTAAIGEPFTLDWPGLAAARPRRDEYNFEVMRRLAALLPERLRGPFVAAAPPDED